MKSHGPILSVIISSCNQLDALKFTLLSLRDQTPDIPHEVIVVDCGSTDGTDQFLAGLAGTGTFHTIFEKEMKSRVAARNQGAHLAKGRHLMFLDPGVIMGPHWWESPVRTLEKDPKVAAAAGKIILPDGRIDHAGLALLEWWDSPTESQPNKAYGNRLTARSIQAGKPAESPGSNQPLSVQALAGEALMIRASAFFAVGGFSARLGRDHFHQKPDFSGELAGVDICLRLGSRGWDCVYRHESVMTRLRLVVKTDHDRSLDYSALKEQEVFDKTWLGRARGDFRVMARQGTVPAEQNMIHRYIEPVISYGPDIADQPASTPVSFSRHMASVIVSTENNLEETQRCMQALLAHTDRSHELIFVDGGSTDGTREYLEEMADQNYQVKVLNNEQPLGSAAAHNLGLAMAGGHHLVLLSSSAVVTPNWLEILSTTADNHPRAGLVGPMTNHHAGLQQKGQLDYDQDSLRGLNSYAAILNENLAGKTDQVMRLSGFCLLIKRELMARIGGLDEKFNLGSYEGNDYGLRAKLAGYQALVARSCFVHNDSKSILTNEQIQQLDQLQRQWEAFKAKWGIPRETTLGEPMNMDALLVGGYQAGRHFQPLPQILKPEKKQKQAAHA